MRAGGGQAGERAHHGSALRQESNEIALILSDDGAGLDLGEAAPEGAGDRACCSRGKEPTDAELMQLIFASGLSTADAVTELSGRGVGMDVVRNEIAAIGGTHRYRHARAARGPPSPSICRSPSP